MIIRLISLFLIATILVSCSDVPDISAEQASETLTQQTSEPTAHPTPTDSDTTSSINESAVDENVADENTTDDAFTQSDDTQTDTLNVELDISTIPYYGEREKFRLPAEIALAYADAIQEAYVSVPAYGSYDFDDIWPRLVDVSDDGIPLLLLIDKKNQDESREGGNASKRHTNLLFGYMDGKLQQIVEGPTSVGVLLDDEKFLVLMDESISNVYVMYRVNNGAAEVVSKTEFREQGFDERIFLIDEVEVSKNEYQAALSKFRIERLFVADRYGYSYDYTTDGQSYSRDQLVQIFQDYAESLPKQAALDTSWKAELPTQIPYYGDRNNCRLSSEQLEAYADAIQSARRKDDYSTFDTFYPVFLDVANDGKPLLMLFETSEGINLFSGEWVLPFIIFGYDDGLQQFDEHRGIAVSYRDGERLLCAYSHIDFGASFTYYRIKNGAAELIYDTYFITDWHSDTFKIEEDDASEDEVQEAINQHLDAMTEILFKATHPGTFVHSSFIAYTARPFSREHAAQILLDHAHVNP